MALFNNYIKIVLLISAYCFVLFVSRILVINSNKPRLVWEETWWVIAPKKAEKGLFCSLPYRHKRPADAIELAKLSWRRQPFLTHLPRKLQENNVTNFPWHLLSPVQYWLPVFYSIVITNVYLACFLYAGGNRQNEAGVLTLVWNAINNPPCNSSFSL